MPIFPIFPGGGGGGGGDSTLSTINITADYQVLVTDQYITSDGGNTITLPLLANAVQPVFISNTGTSDDTVDGNGETVPGGTVISMGQVRGFIPTPTAWTEA